jgi:hypothetical protein
MARSRQVGIADDHYKVQASHGRNLREFEAGNPFMGPYRHRHLGTGASGSLRVQVPARGGCRRRVTSTLCCRSSLHSGTVRLAWQAKRTEGFSSLTRKKSSPSKPVETTVCYCARHTRTAAGVHLHPRKDSQCTRVPADSSLRAGKHSAGRRNKTLPTGEYALRVKGGKEYTVTRTYKKHLHTLAQLWIGMSSFVAG